jgi:hypothetical protein
MRLQSEISWYAVAMLPSTLPIFSPSQVAALAAATCVVPQTEKEPLRRLATVLGESPELAKFGGGRPLQSRQSILLSVGVSREVLERWFERRAGRCLPLWELRRLAARASHQRGAVPASPLLHLWPGLKHHE